MHISRRIMRMTSRFSDAHLAPCICVHTHARAHTHTYMRYVPGRVRGV